MSERKKEYYEQFVNKRQGSLLIIGVDHMAPRTGRLWKCQCDCGRIVLLPTYRIASGSATSCPECGKAENRKQAAEHLTTHGLSRRNKRLYAAWKAIISRCTYPGDTDYKYYGGAGIDYADEWKEFPAFYEWAISHGYRDDLTIDRIDNSRGYYPDNCRWETDKVQGINHSNSILVTIMGTTMCLNDWARAAGVWRQTVYQWRKAGIMEEKIRKRLPHGYTGRTVLIKGQQVTLYEEAV